MPKLFVGLPQTFPAAVFAAMHIPGSLRSELPEILSSNGRCGVSNAEDNQVFEHGRVYLAPADFHLVLQPNERMALWHGPKESYFRPAINPLFRSAAEIYKERVIGVILTGSLDDGVAGLAAVKRQGGLAVVQDPEDAAFPNLPRAALENVPVDHVAPVSDMPELLIQLTRRGDEK